MRYAFIVSKIRETCALFSVKLKFVHVKRDINFMTDLLAKKVVRQEGSLLGILFRPCYPTIQFSSLASLQYSAGWSLCIFFYLFLCGVLFLLFLLKNYFHLG